MDLVGRLKSIADLKAGDPIPDWLKGANGWGDALSQMCRDAIAEIEHLRSVAGVVSQGPSLYEIRETSTPWVVLKAFDGA